MILLPDGTTGTNDWTYSGGSSIDNAVTSDDGASSYAREGSNNAQVTFTLADPSVDEDDIDSITSVQIILKANYTHPSAGATVGLRAQQTGTGIFNGVDNFDVAGGAPYNAYTGTARTTSALADWTYTNLENLRIKLLTTSAPASRTELRVSYLYALVTYVEGGYGNDVMGVASGNVAKVNGIAAGNIAKVNGI